MITTCILEIIRVLKKSKKPMTPKEITKEIIQRGNVILHGLTPQATISARILEEIKEKGKNSAFIKTPTGFILNKQNIKI
jgi:hypothetical protein